MTTSRWHYSRALAEQLRVNGVAELRVREIVAEVESHVKETGEDPVAAFGQPVDYAAQWQPLSVRHWAKQMGIGVVLALGAASGLTALLADGSWTADVPLGRDELMTLVLMFVLAVLIPWTVDLWLSRRRAARLGESTSPRYGHLRFLAIAGIWLVVGMLAWLVGDAAGSTTLLDVPRWLLAVVCAVGVPLGLLGDPQPGDSTYPRAPGSLGGKESWKSRVRRAFVSR